MSDDDIEYEVLETSLVDYGHFGKSEDQIIYIEDFVDVSDLSYIQNFVKSINKWENGLDDSYNENGDCTYQKSYWWDRVCSGAIIEELDTTAFEIIEHYVHKMGLLIQDKYKVVVHERPPVLVRWLPGNKQEPHADKQLNDGQPNAFPLYDINSIIYWNDDFEGGEFYYPDFSKEFKIKAGMAVCHPGDVNYLHGVKEIRSGVRWTTPSFYTITDFKEE